MSKLPFELLLALRYLRPRRTFVSIITLISIVGVALGVAVLIIVISVMSGFDHDLREKILGFNAPIQIGAMDPATFQSRPMQNYEEVMRMVSSNKNISGVAPFVMGPVLVETQPTNGVGALFATPYLRGVDVNAEGSVSVLPVKILSGGSFDLSGQGVIIGSVFAAQMGLDVGDRLSIYSPDEIKKLEEQIGTTNRETVLPDDYTVTGIFDVGYYDYNANIIAVSIENAQDLYDLNDSVHGLEVKLADPYQAPEVKTELQGMLGLNFEITTWEEQNSALLGAIQVEKNVMFYLLFFIVLVAALCILSAQITFVVQKTREIGMLKAIGATNLQISGIFLGQSAIIGIFGVLSGLGFGILALTYRNQFLHLMNRWTGFELFPAKIYGFGDLPAIIAPRDVAVICISSFIICILGGVLPAFRAGRLKPVEALRYE
jgi:lipoprotein-releasing system permease protein